MAKLAVKRIGKSKSAEAVELVTQDTTQQLDRRGMIALGAYLRAEQRGFQSGDPVADWLASEAEVDRSVNK